VQLTDQPDEIWWKWTPDGVYSAKSVYEAHFKSSYCTFNSRAIWRAKAEGKHRSFAWLLVQQKILTADKLIARNWPCDPVCPLCDQEQQTAEHLCLHCVFAREVWMLVSGWSNGLVQAPNPGSTLEEWWNTSMQGQSKEMGRQVAALLIYISLNLWKERNRRIFEGVTASPVRVLNLIKEEMKLRMVATGEDGISFVS
jgi:hypothetical protein